jgi:hypothetical protein
MTAITEGLYKHVRAKDLLADPMHPDDFLARWYAQGLVETVKLPVSVSKPKSH